MNLLFDNTLKLRIRIPITNKHEHRNFITKITTYEYICSIPTPIIVLDELLPYVLNMAINKITGTYNLTNPGVISHNEILEMYKKYVNTNFTWKNFSVENQSKILATGRSNNCLDIKKLKTLYPKILSIKESVKNILKNFNK